MAHHLYTFFSSSNVWAVLLLSKPMPEEVGELEWLCNFTRLWFSSCTLRICRNQNTSHMYSSVTEPLTNMMKIKRELVHILCFCLFFVASLLLPVCKEKEQDHFSGVLPGNPKSNTELNSKARVGGGKHTQPIVQGTALSHILGIWKEKTKGLASWGVWA